MSDKIIFGHKNVLLHELQHAIQDIEGFAKGGNSDNRDYHRISGEVEARNVEVRMDMTEEERRNSLASETEDVAREDQIFIMDNLGSSEMGSRVNKRMEEIAQHFNGAELNSEQQAVVDVYSGKADNKSISIEREDGKRKIVMRQGHEDNAGAKHSIYRHFNRNEGTITADDIILIPKVLKVGERKKGKKPNSYTYTIEKMA